MGVRPLTCMDTRSPIFGLPLYLPTVNATYWQVSIGHQHYYIALYGDLHAAGISGTSRRVAVRSIGRPIRSHFNGANQCGVHFGLVCNEKSPDRAGAFRHILCDVSLVGSKHPVATDIRVIGRCVGLDLQGMAIFSVSAVDEYQAPPFCCVGECLQRAICHLQSHLLARNDPIPLPCLPLTKR